MLAAAAGSAYSAPSVAIVANGTIDVAVEGPSDTLFFSWRMGRILVRAFPVSPARGRYSRRRPKRPSWRRAGGFLASMLRMVADQLRRRQS